MGRIESESHPSQSIDWYAHGESHTVEVDGICITVRLVGRKGRRARISIVAPPGAKFSTPPKASQKIENPTVTETRDQI